MRKQPLKANKSCSILTGFASDMTSIKAVFVEVSTAFL